MTGPKMFSLVAALAVTAWSCSGHIADTWIDPGDRVRVTAPSLDLDKDVGTVASLVADTFVVEMEDRADALDVPFSHVTRLEVHRGQKSRAGAGALIGAGAGAATGLTVALVSCAGDECHLDGSDVTGAVVLVLGAGSALAGAGLGALIGTAIKTDRWQLVPLDRIRVGRSPATPDGVALSVTLRL